MCISLNLSPYYFIDYYFVRTNLTLQLHYLTDFGSAKIKLSRCLLAVILKFSRRHPCIIDFEKTFVLSSNKDFCKFNCMHNC